MQDKIKILIVTTILCLMYCVTAFAYTGKGTSSKPYSVSSESDLRTILLEKSTSGTVYIKITGNISIKKTISIKKGKFVIYAGGENRVIKRSGSKSADINNQSNPGYCMKIDSGVSVSVGSKGDYLLTLGGNKDDLSGIIMSGWLRIESGGVFELGSKGRIRNCNSNETDTGTPIMVLGTMNVSGEIYSCEGNNGGAIKNYGGTLNLKSGAKIHNCTSRTEGGAIYNAHAGVVTITDANIYNCTAKDEGGAILSKEANSQCNIISGNIYGNTSGQTGGAIFSGYGATLNIGNDTAGPVIYNNVAGESGGAIRCNGGAGDKAGGYSYFNRGSITGNISGKNGGAISCGPSSQGCASVISIKNMAINNNQSEKSGGGIWLPDIARGASGEKVEISNCAIKNNVSKYHGGGIFNGVYIELWNNIIENNTAEGCGGGVHIKDIGVVEYRAGTISGNKTNNRTVDIGVYVNGKFMMGNTATVNANNVVYLAAGKCIEVIEKLSDSYSYVAKIESAVKNNGTGLVYVNYSGGTAEKVLYYKGSSDDEYMGTNVEKRFLAVGLSQSQLLRTGKKVVGLGGQWVIISEKYLIKYDSNTTDEVKNMPDAQLKFWREQITISNKVPTRKNYVVDEEKHWNTMANGKGTKIESNSAYNVDETITLYAQWKKEDPHVLYVLSKNRYYIKHQKIELNAAEIIKKISVSDDMDSGYPYRVYIKEIRDKDDKLIVADTDIQPEKYINTNEIQEYKIKTYIKGKTQLLSTTIDFYVYIVEEAENIGTVRFISNPYLYTLSESSKWNMNLRHILKESLGKKQGQGKYNIKYTSQQLKNIKSKMTENNYKITKELNESIIKGW